MIFFKDALQIIKETAQRSRKDFPADFDFIRNLNLSHALGKVIAADLISSELLPPFDNSAMDGFAILSSWTAKASVDHPIHLPVLGSVAAGDKPSPGNDQAGVWEIMTGAPLPKSCDSVLRIEDVKITRNSQGHAVSIEIHQPVIAKTYVRFAGSDFSKGQMILKKGMWLQSQHILALAGLGFSAVPVMRSLRAARISTGKELVNHDQTPGLGQIRNSTAPYFSSLLPQLDVDVVYEVSVGDDPADFAEALKIALALKVDLILTTGAVSMGKYDFVVEEIKKLQAKIHFHKVAMQPGKPLLFASFEQGPVLFGLPGNPVSGMVGLRFFVEAYLRALRGQEEEKPFTLRLLKNHKKPEGLRQFAKAVIHYQDGEAKVEALAGQMSYMLSPLMQSNAWVVLQEDLAQVNAEEIVDVYPLFSN